MDRKTEAEYLQIRQLTGTHKMLAAKTVLPVFQLQLKVNCPEMETLPQLTLLKEEESATLLVRSLVKSTISQPGVSYASTTVSFVSNFW